MVVGVSAEADLILTTMASELVDTKVGKLGNGESEDDQVHLCGGGKVLVDSTAWVTCSNTLEGAVVVMLERTGCVVLIRNLE